MQPALPKPLDQGNMAENFGCRGIPYTSEKHGYSHYDENRAVSDDIPAQIAILSVEKCIIENDGKRATKRCVRIKR